MWPEMICPEDGQPLTLAREELTCPRGHEWGVHAGIPRMIPRKENYADAFGLQWKVYRKVQLDSFTGTTLSLDRARRCLGGAGWDLLRAGAQVLEVGCGAGRFTEVLLGAGASVTSVDLSSAVEANQDNFPQDRRHRILQADVLRLPFAPQQYDVVFCLGVIQHTPDPEKTIEKLYQQVKPGGWVVSRPLHVPALAFHQVRAAVSTGASPPAARGRAQAHGASGANVPPLASRRAQ